MTQFDEYFVDAFDMLELEFGETVTYYPRAGGSRTMTAIVDRSPPEVWTPAGAITPSLTIRVQNDASIGISHDEIDAGDQVLVAVVAKGTPERRTFMSTLNSDGQVTEIAVR